MLTIAQLKNNPIMHFINEKGDSAMEKMDAFHHLRLRARIFASEFPCADTPGKLTLVLQAKGETEDAQETVAIGTPQTFKGSDVEEFLQQIFQEISGSFQTTVFIQITPILSLIIHNTAFAANMEIQFINMSMGAFLEMIQHPSRWHFKAYPGYEMNILIRPLEYQHNVDNFKQDASVLSHKEEQNSASQLQNDFLNFLRASEKNVQHLVDGHMGDARHRENNSVHITDDTTAEVISHILQEHGQTRSEYNEKDNDMQKQISSRKLTDASKNVPEMEVVDDQDVNVPFREATDENLNALFGDEEDDKPSS